MGVLSGLVKLFFPYSGLTLSGIIDDFDVKTKKLYHARDVQRGYVLTIDRQKMDVKVPLITISLALLSNEHRELDSHVQISAMAAELKKIAKSRPGSVIVQDSELY